MQQDGSTSSAHDASIHDDNDAIRLVESLEGNHHLKKLTISFEEEATVSEENAAALASAVALVPVVTLTLIWQEFQTDLHSMVARRLMEAVRASLTIQHLDLHSMVGEVEFLVGALTKLESLGLYDDWNPEDLHQLGDSLHRTSTLTTLDLNGVNLDSADALGLLSLGLAKNSSIKSVAFRGCGISDDGVKAFVEHWRQDSQIQTLEWNSNVIQAEGALLLIDAGSSRPALENLHIMANEDIGYEGLANFALKLPYLVLKRLSFTTCVPDTIALDPILKEQRKFLGSLLTTGAKVNTHLVKFDMNGSGIFIDCPGMAEEIDFYTGRNEFQPLMQSVPPTLWCRIFANCLDDASLTFYFLKEQPLLWPESKNTNRRPEKKQRRGS